MIKSKNHWINSIEIQCLKYHWIKVTILQSFRYIFGDIRWLKIISEWLISESTKTKVIWWEIHYFFQLESMEEDLKFFEDLFNFPKVWDYLQYTAKSGQVEKTLSASNKSSVSFNPSSKKYSNAEYLSQLKPWELKVIHKIHTKDFAAFNYEPCDALF